MQGQQGANAESIRRDIAGILHTLNQAFDNLYDNCLLYTSGALIVLERHTNLSEIVRTGKPVNSAVNLEVLGTIFCEGTPLHDGAAIIENGRIKAAGCVLPLSNNLDLGKEDVYKRQALSFATRYYQCNAGIMVTASHNPAKYNGYKAYGPDLSLIHISFIKVSFIDFSLLTDRKWKKTAKKPHNGFFEVIVWRKVA